MAAYNTEQYWNEVAATIAGRKDGNVIAGDDEPYYHYKRKLFLRLFHSLPVLDRSVLEIGSGPGGNLRELSRMGCARIAGADISGEMVALSKKMLAGTGAEIVKTDGLHLPFADGAFDLVFTSTVLQHNTDEEKLRQLVAEIGRVAANDIVLFERIEQRMKGHASNLGRPVSYYAALFSAHGFVLTKTNFLPIQVSYYTCGAIRKLFNSRGRKEGEPVSRLSYILQSIVLPVTKLLDRIIPSKRDLGMLYFRREQIQ